MQDKAFVQIGKIVIKDDDKRMDIFLVIINVY